MLETLALFSEENQRNVWIVNYLDQNTVSKSFGSILA